MSFCPSLVQVERMAKVHRAEARKMGEKKYKKSKY
jgi:hypothetical protein